ncbi:MAG: hypothetical protein EBX52_02550 [Proteobacteria bacterium]|nr:hypothetical protein [Pseudomonadota bacterium]
MSSFLYLYSKFTEELLLLSAAILFALLAVYCYQWVIKKRRLGAARNEIPATVVKAYLNQLIHEAQFVRTQLFGLMNGASPDGDPMNLLRTSPAAAPSTADAIEALLPPQGGVPTELEERLKALQKQLSEKESIVVNINVEKTKLLEEIENLRQNQKAMQSAGSAGAGSDELARRVKELEARLEEYSLFEDDLANLKRLQQENQQLRKKLEAMGSNLGLPAEPAPAPVVAVTEAPPLETPAPAPVEANPVQAPLDQATIDALLSGTSATPPVAAAAPEPVAEPATKDAFENLVASVDTSLNVAPSLEPAPAAAPAPAPAPAAPALETGTDLDSLAAKSDEELLKEFENLLNS